MSTPIAPSLLSKMNDQELRALIQSATNILAQRYTKSEAAAEAAANPVATPSTMSTPAKDDMEYHVKKSPSNVLEEADNLFDFLKKRRITHGEIAEAWGTTYLVWWNNRKTVKKLSMERIYLLARLAQVMPEELFLLTLNCYPQQPDGTYSFDEYREKVKQDLTDLTVQKK